MQVRIYKNTKLSTQPKNHSENVWLLEFVAKSDSKFKENLMGRTGSNDMANEIKIKFPSLETATAFAQSKNYDFEIIKPKEPKLIKKSYASNFG